MLLERIKETFAQQWPQLQYTITHGIWVIDVTPDIYLDLCSQLRKDFEQLTDLTIVDKLVYGQASWNTTNSTSHGFSRAQLALDFSRAQTPFRFEAIVHFLSYSQNARIKVRCKIDTNLSLPSLTALWPGANWYEREAFDLFGIVFENHPDLRRLLTDYGFTGYPFRKDFPMLGYDQVIYDGSLAQCRLEPVNIEHRVVTPRVIRGEQAL